MTLRTADHSSTYHHGLAEVYDLVYRGRGKDYRSEAADVMRLVQRYRQGTAMSLLDVACGTGLHLQGFAGHVDRCEGADISADMLAVAGRRNPDVRLHESDMADLHLDRSFDVVTCMFSSIALMPTVEMLGRAAAGLVRHLTIGGVVVCEPWWFPETFLDGYVGAHLIEVDDWTVARVSHSRLERGATLIREDFLVAHPVEGLRHFSNSLSNTLFERKDYELAFQSAGCPVDFFEGGPSGRGLFVGTRRA